MEQEKGIYKYYNKFNFKLLFRLDQIRFIAVNKSK